MFQSNSSNFSRIQTPRTFWFLVQILGRILKSSNKESCSLFNSLHIHILYENFQACEVYLLTESIQIKYKNPWIILKCHYSSWARPPSPFLSISSPRNCPPCLYAVPQSPSPSSLSPCHLFSPRAHEASRHPPHDALRPLVHPALPPKSHRRHRFWIHHHRESTPPVISPCTAPLLQLDHPSSPPHRPGAAGTPASTTYRLKHHRWKECRRPRSSPPPHRYRGFSMSHASAYIAWHIPLGPLPLSPPPFPTSSSLSPLVAMPPLVVTTTGVRSHRAGAMGRLNHFWPWAKSAPCGLKPESAHHCFWVFPFSKNLYLFKYSRNSFKLPNSNS
jgi:hypothetical protein